MALIYFNDNDPWLTEYETCEKLFREIMEQLTARNRELRTSQMFASVSANIRICMKQYTAKVQQLKGKLDDASRLKTITTEEAERRARQIELLESKDVQLQKLHDSRKSDLVSSRTNLLSFDTSVFADRGTTSWAADGNDDDDDDQPIDINVSVGDLKSHQERVLKEQEEGLEQLCKVIARQKEIGQTISNEVDHQNEIIDDLADHMDKTDESLINKTKAIQHITSKDCTWGYWVVIILLFITIIAIASI